LLLDTLPVPSSHNHNSLCTQSQLAHTPKKRIGHLVPSCCPRSYLPLFPTFFSPLVALLVGLLIQTHTSGLFGQDNLPPESELPEENISVDLLPSESELPDSDREWIILPADLPGVPLQVSNDLPDESELPFSADDPQVGDPLFVSAVNHLQKELPPIGMPAGDGPWLRMNFRGHTATVRSLHFTADSARLCSGGDDKVVHVWSKNPLVRNATSWMHERVVRWQIQRGPRGRIYALSTGQSAGANQQLAIAGHGAMAGLGEISVFDPTSGKLRRALYDEKNGHRQVIAAIALREKTLLSADVSGKVIAWRPDAETGVWNAKVLYEDDLASYGPVVEKQLQPWRRFVPIALLDDNRAIIPRLAPPRPDSKVPYWQLELVDLTTGAKKRLDGQLPGMVISLAVSADGNLVAACDATRSGSFTIWNIANNTQQKKKATATVLALKFSKGNHLLLGTQRDQNGRAHLQRWELTQDKYALKGQLLLRENVLACAVSPDGKSYAYTQADRILVGKWKDFGRQNLGDRQILKAAIDHPTRVAFIRDRQRYRIAIAVDPDGKVFKESFDLDKLQFGRENKIPAENVIDSSNGGQWTLKRNETPTGPSYVLHFAGQPKSRLPIEVHVHGELTSLAWIRNSDGKVVALAVGTNGRNEITLFELSDNANATIWQNFRGHEDAVTSIGASMNGRYLVSAARDGTIRFWNLATFVAEVDTAKRMQNRWGMELVVEDEQVRVQNIDEASSPYFRGLRDGAHIKSIQWFDGTKAQIARDAETIQSRMLDLPFETLLNVQVAPPGKRERMLALLPAWRPLASMFVTNTKEWAFWTPTGYYDASFNGHKSFGWQVNQGIYLRSEFFLAAQMRKKLERPDVLRNLLKQGSLSEAFRADFSALPTRLDQVVADEYRLRPRVEILSPTSNDEIVSGDSVAVRAAITVRDGQQHIAPKLFSNGVVATERELEQRTEVPGGHRYVYHWRANLPNDPRIRMEVVAASAADTSTVEHVIVNRETSLHDQATMYAFTAGINQYRDSQIPRLQYAVANATRVSQIVSTQSHPLYRPEVVSLLDGHATRALWHAVTKRNAETIRPQVRANDLILIYLSGHGVRDEKIGKYYFVAADARYDDVKSHRYEDCLSLDDLSAFADIPCRKLIVLDTCHSGAIQENDQRQLKAAVRTLQDDQFLILTASDGSQEAVEESKRGMGRFTAHFTDGLRAAADLTSNGGDNDGIVSFREISSYVQRQVGLDSASSEYRQTPTVSPSELVDLINLPLTLTQ
jgi:WD40 repeat protein